MKVDGRLCGAWDSDFRMSHMPIEPVKNRGDSATIYPVEIGSEIYIMDKDCYGRSS